MSTTTLQLHGAPALRLPGGRGLVLSAREAALLAWLHLEGPTPRALLAGRLWAGGDEAKARANLRQTLVRLKRAAGAVVAEDERGLRLDEAVAVAPDAGARLLGTLEFDDAPELAAWLTQRREAAERDRLREGLATARAHLQAGELDAALAAADALLAADPAVEEAHRVRMEVFYARGDRAAAIAAWDGCRDALRSAFGIAPSAATNALGQLLLAGGGEAPTASSPPAAALPAALRRPPTLVGRETTQAQLQQALSQGQAVVLAGPGGIGKSRLLAEGVARAAAREAALVVGARPGDALLPGAVLARLLGAALAQHRPLLDASLLADVRRLLPAGSSEPAALPSALAQRRLLGALPRVLQACRARGLQLVAVDDLQFADELSLTALQLLVGAWRAAPAGELLLLFGLRPDEAPPAAHTLLDLLAGSGRCQRFDLATLQAADVEALLHSLPWAESGRHIDPAALAPQLLARVGGNPAWLLECLKSLWLDTGASPGEALPLPPTLREAVRQRLQRLPDAALQLAQLAAVAGRDFSLPLAATLLHRSPLQLAPLLAALEAAQVFQGLVFSHDLVADAVLASLPAALRPLLHQGVAQQLVAQRDPPAAPTSIAHHLQQAGDHAAAAPWWLRAAQRARRQWQMAEAATAYQAAAAALPTREEQLDTWFTAARCWLWARDEHADAALAQAAALVQDAAEAARLHTLQTIAAFNTRRLADALALATALIDELGRQAAHLSPATLADGVRVMTSLVASGLDIERVLALVDRLLPQVQHDADALLALRTSRGGLLHWAAQPQPAAEALEAALAQAEREGDPGPRVVLGNQLMRVRHALGDLPGATTLGLQVLARCQPLEMGAVFQADVMHVVAMIDAASGRAAGGLARFDALLRHLAEAKTPVPDLFLTTHASMLIVVGRLAEAESVLAQHPAPGRPGQALQDLGHQATLARLALAQGRSAERWLAAIATPPPLPPGLVLQHRVILATLREGGDADDLQSLVEELGRRGMRGLQRAAAQAAARAALAAGRPAQAVALVRLALDHAAEVDAWVDEPASVWHTAAQVLAGCGEADAARAAAQRGAAWVREGAVQWRRTAEREAWLHGNRRHHELLRLGA
jgi:DNA-binding SARP family transcriptional activator